MERIAKNRMSQLISYSESSYRILTLATKQFSLFVCIRMTNHATTTTTTQMISPWTKYVCVSLYIHHVGSLMRPIITAHNQELSCDESHLEALLILPRHFVTAPEFNDLNEGDHAFDERRCLMKRLRGRAEPTFVVRVTDLKMCGAHVQIVNKRQEATLNRKSQVSTQIQQAANIACDCLIATINSGNISQFLFFSFFQFFPIFQFFPLSN